METGGGTEAFGAVRFVQGRNFAALIPLRRGRKPALGAILSGLEAVLAGTGARIELDPLHVELARSAGGQDVPVRWLDRGTAFLLVNGVQVMLAWNPSDSPRPVWLSDYVNRQLWPDAARDLARCSASVVVSEMGIPGEDGMAAAFDRAAAVTLVAEQIWGSVSGIGVLWSPARNALPAARASAAFETLRGGRAALTLWMRLREIAPPPGSRPGLSPGIATEGLLPILGREIEAAPSPVPAAEMRQHIVHLASGLVDHQAALRDGHVFARRTEHSLTLNLRERGLSSDAPVYALTIAPEAA